MLIQGIEFNVGDKIEVNYIKTTTGEEGVYRGWVEEDRGELVNLKIKWSTTMAALKANGEWKQERQADGKFKGTFRQLYLKNILTVSNHW